MLLKRVTFYWYTNLHSALTDCHQQPKESKHPCQQRRLASGEVHSVGERERDRERERERET